MLFFRDFLSNLKMPQSNPLICCPTRGWESHEWRGKNQVSRSNTYAYTLPIPPANRNPSDPDLAPANTQFTGHIQGKASSPGHLPSSHHPGQESHTSTSSPPLQLPSLFLRALVLSSSSIPFSTQLSMITCSTHYALDWCKATTRLHTEFQNPGGNKREQDRV